MSSETTSVNPLDISIVMHTWGCKVNTYDTGLLQARFAKAGLGVQSSVTDAVADAVSVRSSVGAARVHVLNTCAVTEEASREAARQVRKIKSREPFSKVVVTGCGAQVDGGIFDELPGADLVVANSHKGHIEELIQKLFKGTLEGRVHRSNIFRKEDLEEGGGLESDHTRAFLKIQDGCNSFCTYCVIPFARGKSRSIPIAKLVSRVHELYAAGARELVLTGVHIGDYDDNGKTFEDLVETVLKTTPMPRIRLSSLEPVELSERLLDLYVANERLCRHFHLSIQSANTETLKRMRRNYAAEDVEKAMLAIRSRFPRAYIGMDLIVGFPGETEEEFEDTYQRLVSLPWTRIHVFPYSERPGTKALKLEGSVPQHIRARRAEQMRSLSLARFQSEAQQEVGVKKLSLVLRTQNQKPNESPALNGAPVYQTLASDYWPVRIASAEPLAIGNEIEVRIDRFVSPGKGRVDGWLEGTVLA